MYHNAFMILYYVHLYEWKWGLRLHWAWGFVRSWSLVLGRFFQGSRDVLTSMRVYWKGGSWSWVVGCPPPKRKHIHSSHVQKTNKYDGIRWWNFSRKLRKQPGNHWDESQMFSIRVWLQWIHTQKHLTVLTTQIQTTQHKLNTRPGWGKIPPLKTCSPSMAQQWRSRCWVMDMVAVMTLPTSRQVAATAVQ